MKALEWQRLLQEQRDRHAKVLFTPTELANADGCSAASIRVVLQRLVNRGVIRRYTEGRYGLPDSVSIEDLVPSIDTSAYITGMSALYRHGLVTQRPSETLCFTKRRHNRSRKRDTHLGRIVFVCISSKVYDYPEDSVIAAPEQSFCDFIYQVRKQNVLPESLVTFRNLNKLDPEELKARLSRYPSTVATSATRLLSNHGCPTGNLGF